MESIYKKLKELERESIQRSKEAIEAGESAEWEDGYVRAIIEIESWIDANSHEIEDGYGNFHTVVSAAWE